MGSTPFEASYHELDPILSQANRARELLHLFKDEYYRLNLMHKAKIHGELGQLELALASYRG